jgi:PilZ domain
VKLLHGQEELVGETVDVSLNGLLSKAQRTLPAGSRVRLSLELSPKTKPIEGAGSIVRVFGETQMGVQMDELTVGESERLQEFLLPLISHE